MHPAKSIILFTTLSGLGFGLLAFLGFGAPKVSGWLAFIYFALAFAMASGGLIASTFHLGHPERALKAFTQWRTSWLSREGWLACATLGVTGIYAAMIHSNWSHDPENPRFTISERRSNPGRLALKNLVNPVT